MSTKREAKRFAIFISKQHIRHKGLVSRSITVSELLSLGQGTSKWASKRATLNAAPCVKFVAAAIERWLPYFNFLVKKSPPVERNNMMMVKNSQMLYRAKHRRKSPIKKVATIMSSTVYCTTTQHTRRPSMAIWKQQPFFFREKKNSTYDTSRKLATIYGRESWVVFT